MAASSISTAFVNQYSSTLYALSQQQGSRLKPYVRNETQKSEKEFFDIIGATTAVSASSRHEDTPLIETDHTRRVVTLTDKRWATLIDKPDKLRMMIDPTSDYMKNAANALGRAMDDVIIAAALGTAYGGSDGTTSYTMAASNYIGAVDGGALSKLNTATLRRIKKKLDQAEVDENIKRHILVDAEQIEGLLSETETTSSDFNTVKALVRGEINEFMGFTFHRSERLASSGAFTIATDTGVVTLSTGNGDSSRQCFAWAEDGLILSTAQGLTGRIDERSDKNYSTQVYASLSVGAVRIEEAKVVGVLCKAS